MKRFSIEKIKFHASQHVCDQVYEDVWVWVAEEIGDVGGWRVADVREAVRKNWYNVENEWK